MNLLNTYFYRELPVLKENILGSIPTWGPEYKLSVEIYIDSFGNSSNNRNTEILRLNAGDAAYGKAGYMIPALYTDSGTSGNLRQIQIATQIGDNWSWSKTIPVSRRTWYTLDLIQYVDNGKVDEEE